MTHGLVANPFEDSSGLDVLSGDDQLLLRIGAPQQTIEVHGALSVDELVEMLGQVGDDHLYGNQFLVLVGSGAGLGPLTGDLFAAEQIPRRKLAFRLV